MPSHRVVDADLWLPRAAASRAFLALALGLGLSSLVACGDDAETPTAPAPVMPPSLAIVVFSDPTALESHQETIRALIVETVDRTETQLDFGQIVFTVTADASRTVPGWGLGGYTLGPSNIEIVVDAASGSLGAILNARLPQIVAHEVHHAVRWRGPGPYGTLLDAFVFEGLADHFANELLGVAPAPWSTALSAAEIDRYLRQARPLFDDPSFNFNEWFFGFGDKPRWTGYSLGYDLVDRYLRNNPGRSAADLVNEPTASFRPD